MSMREGKEKIPSYLKEMLEEKIARAKRLQSNNTFNFLFFTDPHFTGTSTFSDIQAINTICSQLQCEYVACCGDNVDNAATKSLHLENVIACMEQIEVENYFPVKGNHDDNSIQSEGVDNMKYTMLPKEQYEIMFKRLEKKVVFDEQNSFGLYYYYDSPDKKVRSIFLNSIDILYIPDKQRSTAWKYAGQSTYAYSDAQLNWLAHKALCLPNKEWKVILFTHTNPFLKGMIGADELAHNSEVVLGILEAFHQGSSFQSIEECGDFKHAISVEYEEKGQILAFFYGHTHSEQIFERNGITYLSTWNDCPRKSTSNPNAPEREIGTNSEFCLAIITIDLEKPSLTATKIGAGEDFEVDLMK